MTVEDISHRIESLAKERGISKYTLADKCPEVVRATVYNAVSGKMSMKIETLIYICNALEISMRDFFDFEGEIEYHLTNDEKLVIESYRSMEEKQKQRVLGYLSSLTEMNE